MSRKNLFMRQTDEILRLEFQNFLSIREIARSCGPPASTVGDYLKRTEASANRLITAPSRHFLGSALVNKRLS